MSEAFASSGGLAWSPDGSEVWFTAAPVGANQALYATSLSGKTRAVGVLADLHVVEGLK